MLERPDSSRPEVVAHEKVIVEYLFSFFEIQKFKKQPSVSLSFVEAEYRSMQQVVAGLTWLARLLEDLSMPHILPIPLHSDIQTAIYIAKNLVFHEWTKHIELDCHFIR
nr:uncharacterized protein LOC117276654 [Nicotiana tomentosiformis]